MTKNLKDEERDFDVFNQYVTFNEIKQQPQIWKETLEIFEKNKLEISRFLENVLAKEGIRIVLTGAGSSAFVGQCVAPYLNQRLQNNVEFIATTDIVSNPTEYFKPQVPTLLVSFARSGNSPESVATVELAKSLVKDLYQVILTCNPSGKLAAEAKQDEKSYLILMPEATNDKGFAMTSSFTSMVLATLLFFSIDDFDKLSKDIKSISKDGEKILHEKMELLFKVSSLDFERMIFLGSSCLKGLARESALKVLELTSGKVMASYDSYLGFRHGPKSMLNDKSIVVAYLSNNSYTRRYEVDLLREMVNENGNKKILSISQYHDEKVEQISDYFISICDTYKEFHDVFLLFDYIINAQLIALFKSIKLEIDPDNPSPEGIVNRVVKGVRIYPYN